MKTLFKTVLATLALSAYTLHSEAQFQGNIWYFGDSAGVGFFGGIPNVLTDGKVSSEEPSAVISDRLGNLLFYAGVAGVNGTSVIVYNKHHQVMQNGTGVRGNNTISQGCLIVPFPDDSTRFYLFTIDYTGISMGDLRCYYSVVDLALNGGLGSITTKNNLLSNLPVTEHLAAVRHGNGRDWWIVLHGYNNNFFHTFLVSPGNISAPGSQAMGPAYNYPYSIAGQIVFNTICKKICIAAYPGLIFLTDFNRCTGQLSNPVILDNLNSPPDGYYGCSFSPDMSKLYTSMPKSSLLFQYDLNAPDIKASRQVIWTNTNPNVTTGQHLLGPDGRIYIASYTGGYNVQNMNLSVIQDPDKPGLACAFQPYSFSLGDRRSFLGMPNIPNHALGKLAGSPCDTITGVRDVEKKVGQIQIYPNPMSSTLWVQAAGMEPGNTRITVTGIHGREEYRHEAVFGSANWQHEISTVHLARGVYFIRVQSGSSVKVFKVVKM
jgi:hypothetical protein